MGRPRREQHRVHHERRRHPNLGPAYPLRGSGVRRGDHESASAPGPAFRTRTPAASTAATASTGAEESVTTTSISVAAQTTAIAVRTNFDPSTIAITRAEACSAARL